MKPDLDQVLHAAFMVQFCQEAGKKKEGNFDLGPILGEVDWVTELHRLVEGAAC